mgnify:CR=1 FL=1
MGLRRVYQATHDCRVRVDITRQRSQSWGLFGGGPGAQFACGGEGFGGLGEVRFDLPCGLGRFPDLGFGLGQFAGQPGAHFVASLDLTHQARRLGGDHVAFFGDLFEPPLHPGKAARSIAGAGLPAADVGLLGIGPLARDGKGLIVRGETRAAMQQLGAPTLRDLTPAMVRRV